MAATKTVAHRLRSRKSRVPEILAANPQLLIAPRHGTITLFGYGISVRIDRGHLVLEDGIGADRRYARLPRIGHRLRRLVVIGSDGMISLAALRWLADQDAAFVMLERDGSVLTTTGPVRPSDARLRRAQARADQSGVALRITRELISRKLAEQERVARHRLSDADAANTIGHFRALVSTAESVQTIRILESQAGAAYWSAWRTLPIRFPRQDLPRVPDHWCTFEARTSPLSRSPRTAANPVNAILNYLYALLEAEARLAATALGLDPGLGFLHADTPNRDSLACDLMEPVRPKVDAYVLDRVANTLLKREWFFEKRDGNCRLMGGFAKQLTYTTSTWAEEVAPVAEWVARTLWTTTSKTSRREIPATRLTQQRRREAKGADALPTSKRPTQPQNLCRGCGASIEPGSHHCPSCAVAFSTERLIEAGQIGRVLAQSPQARHRRSASLSRHAEERRKWRPTDLPSWLTETVFIEKIQPILAGTSNAAIISVLGVSWSYAVEIRHAKRIPHPRHWQRLAELVGISGPGPKV